MWEFNMGKSYFGCKNHKNRILALYDFLSLIFDLKSIVFRCFVTFLCFSVLGLYNAMHGKTLSAI